MLLLSAVDHVRRPVETGVRRTEVPTPFPATNVPNVCTARNPLPNGKCSVATCLTPAVPGIPNPPLARDAEPPNQPHRFGCGPSRFVPVSRSILNSVTTRTHRANPVPHSAESTGIPWISHSSYHVLIAGSEKSALPLTKSNNRHPGALVVTIVTVLLPSGLCRNRFHDAEMRVARNFGQTRIGPREGTRSQSR